MKRLLQYLVGVLAIAPIWFIFSFILSLMWVGAMDSDMDTTSPVHFRVVIAVNAIVDFPMRYIQDWNGPPAGMSEQTYVTYGFVGMFINSIFWAFVLVFFYRLVAPLFRKKRREFHDAA
jgi:hypothetical protein